MGRKLAIVDRNGDDQIAHGVKVLVNLLNGVPDAYMVSRNAVGNLMILNADGIYWGYIDLHDMTIQMNQVLDEI